MLSPLVWLLAQQRVVMVRPPPHTLRRGLFALPPTLTAAVVLACVVGLVGWTLYRRLRARG